MVIVSGEVLGFISFSPTQLIGAGKSLLLFAVLTLFGETVFTVLPLFGQAVVAILPFLR